MSSVLVLGYRQSGRTFKLVSQLVDVILNAEQHEEVTRVLWVCADSLEEADVIRAILNQVDEILDRKDKDLKDQDRLKSLLDDYNVSLGFIHTSYVPTSTEAAPKGFGSISTVQQLAELNHMDIDYMFLDEFDHYNSGIGEHHLGLMEKLEFVKQNRGSFRAEHLAMAASIPSEWFHHFTSIAVLNNSDKHDVIDNFLVSDLYKDMDFKQYVSELWLTYPEHTLAYETDDFTGIIVKDEAVVAETPTNLTETIMMEDLPIGEDYTEFSKWIEGLRDGTGSKVYYRGTNTDGLDFAVDYDEESNKIIVGVRGVGDDHTEVVYHSDQTFSLDIPPAVVKHLDTTIVSTFGIVFNAITQFEDCNIKLGEVEKSTYTKEVNDQFIGFIEDALTRISKGTKHVAFVSGNNNTTNLVLGLANTIISEKEGRQVYVKQESIAYDACISIINAYFAEKGLLFSVSPASKFFTNERPENAAVFLFTPVELDNPQMTSSFTYVYVTDK